MIFLKDAFIYIDVPQVRKLALLLLDNFPADKIMDDWIFEKLVKSQGAYDECSLQLKREIWARNKDVFHQYVLPLLEQYDQDLLLRLWSREIFPEDIHAVIKKRYTIYFKIL